MGERFLSLALRSSLPGRPTFVRILLVSRTMTLTWTAIVIGVVGLLIAALWSRARARNDTDLGVISHTWLAEQRNGRGDSQR